MEGFSRTFAALLLLPALLAIAAVMAVPIGVLIHLSLLPPGPLAPLEGGPTLTAFAGLLEDPFPTVMGRTVRLGLLTTFATVLLGYPMALMISRSTGLARRIRTLLVVSPLLMSIVVRAYGWVLLLGRQGFLGTFLETLGFERASLLHTETAIVLALTESFLPFMVLALVASLDRVEPLLLDAARSLGASSISAFLRITLPLTLPGLTAGGSFVLVGTLSAYATPALLGGARARTWVLEIHELLALAFDWPTAAAASLLLLAAAMGVMALAAFYSRRRTALWFGA